MTTTFRVGKGIGIVSDTTMALLEPLNAELAEALWSLVDDGGGIDELLQQLSSTGLRSLGSFAMASFEGSQTRIVVRGEARAIVKDGETIRSIEAMDVKTWVEVLVSTSDVELTLTKGATGDLPFRIGKGLVPADSLQRGASAKPDIVGASFDWIAEFRPEDSMLDAPTEYHQIRHQQKVEDPERTFTAAEFPPPSAGSSPANPRIEPLPSLSAQETLGLGDHDGRTMTKAQIMAMRAKGAETLPAESGEASMGGATVQALLCDGQHPNSPQSITCRVCNAVLTGAPVHIARPTLGVLHFSDGSSVTLDRPALIGRNPKLEGAVQNEIPNLVRLDVGQGLSRTHASLRLEGWQILLEDLNSGNGTIITPPGREPRRLEPGEAVPLEIGCVVDFGGEISCVVRSA